MSWSKGSKPGLVSVVMTVMVVLLVVPLFVLCNIPLDSAQQLNFWVLNTSVAREQAKPEPSHRNPFFQVGHSARMLCQYNDDFCALRAHTNLTVIPNDVDISLVESHMTMVKTKCNLTLEMSNVTVDMAGRYTCYDTLNTEASRQRRFQIGEKPDLPRNVSLVYRPNANLMVWLKSGRSGQDLNDESTQWNVQYTWLNRSVVRSCSTRKSDAYCRHLSPEGLCAVCVMQLNNYECGMYRHGSIYLNVNFTISVTNRFGTVPATPLTLSAKLTEWVKPGPVASISIKTRATTPSSLALRVAAPKNIDQRHYDSMMSSTKFYLQYSVKLLSARDQSLKLRASRDFNQTYGFVRNLADEEEALRHSVERSRFPYVSEWLLWNSSTICTYCFDDVCNTPRAQRVVVPDLPFAGYHYNVSVNSRACYSGEPVVLRSDKAKTKDSAPLEGPGLHENFAYCLPPSTHLCVTCFIYFKEIPQVKRGGEVIRHTLTLNLTERISNEPLSDCENGEGVTLHIGGQNNTFHIPGLAVGGRYSVEVTAFTEMGFSSTTALLRVTSTPPSFAPRNVIVEKSDVSHDVTWDDGEGARDMNVTYFAHYCYTIPVQVDPSTNTSHNGSVQAPLSLNCVTNMVTKLVDRTSKGFASFDQVSSHRDLTPAFFVSAVGPRGQTSGLQSVDCFYARGRYPSPVDVHSIQARGVAGEPQSLLVQFPLPCGGQLTNRGGRPQFYRLALLPDSARCGDQDCTALLHTSGTLTQPMKSGPRDVEYKWRHLKAGTGYWVGVNTARHDDDFLLSSWRWQHAVTAPADSNWLWWGVIVVVCVGVIVTLLVYAGCKGWKKHKQCKRRFKDFGEIFKHQDDIVSGLSVVERSWGEGTVNPNYESDNLRPLSNNYPRHAGVGVFPSPSASLLASSEEGETACEESGSSIIRPPSPCTTSHRDHNNISDAVTSSVVDNSIPDEPPPVFSRYHFRSQPPPKRSTLSPMPGRRPDTEDDNEHFEEDEECHDKDEVCDDEDVCDDVDDEEDRKCDDSGADDSDDDNGDEECDEKAGLISDRYQTRGATVPCFATLTFPSVPESPMDIASILSAAGDVRSVTPSSGPVLSPSASVLSELCCQSATSETPLLSPNHTPSHALSPLTHALPLLHTPSHALPPLNTPSSRPLKSVPDVAPLPPVVSGSGLTRKASEHGIVPDSSVSSKSPATLTVSSNIQVTRNNSEHDTVPDQTIPVSVTNVSSNTPFTGKCSENGPLLDTSVPSVLPVSMTNVSSYTHVVEKCSEMGERRAVTDSPPDLSISAILQASQTSSIPQLTPSTGPDVSKRQVLVNGNHGDSSGLNLAPDVVRQAQCAVTEVFSGALRPAANPTDKTSTVNTSTDKTSTNKTSTNNTSSDKGESTGRLHHKPCSSLSTASPNNNANKTNNMVHTVSPIDKDNKSNFTVEPVSSNKSNFSNAVAQPVLPFCIPPLDKILQAAEECPWRGDDCEGRGSESSLQHQLSDSDQSSQWRASGHESGFDTDIESSSSTEGEGGSGDSKVDHTHRRPDLRHPNPDLKHGHGQGVASHPPRLKDGRGQHVGKTVIQDSECLGGRCVCDKDCEVRGGGGGGGRELENGKCSMDLPLQVQTPAYSRVTCDRHGDVVSTRL